MHLTDIVRLNVGGTIHETTISTLQSKSGTRLSQKKLLKPHFIQERNEYFFDRNPRAFEAVLDYYRTGELHIPNYICGNIMKGELEYWMLGEDMIEQCCWNSYNSYKEQKLLLTKFEKNLSNLDFEYMSQQAKIDELTAPEWKLRWNRIKAQAWTALEEPESSRPAKVLSGISLFLVLLNIFTFIVETHPAFQLKLSSSHWADFHGVPLHSLDLKQPDATSITSETNVTSGIHVMHEEARVIHPVLEMIDIVCLVFFTLELSVRFFFAPRRLQYALRPLTIIDILSVIPSYIELIIYEVYPQDRYSTTVMDIFFVTRVIRMFRIFRLMKHHTGLHIMIYTFRSSVSEILLLTVFLSIFILIFASLLYFVEHKTNEAISNIPIALWWAVVTMTTIGYGDIYPVTSGGYIVGTAAAVSGVLLIAATVPVIANNFMMYYSHARSTTHRQVARTQPN